MAVKATYAPGERNERLGSRSNADLRQVLTHERHKQNLGVVRALVARLHKPGCQLTTTNSIAN